MTVTAVTLVMGHDLVITAIIAQGICSKVPVLRCTDNFVYGLGNIGKYVLN